MNVDLKGNWKKVVITDKFDVKFKKEDICDKSFRDHQFDFGVSETIDQNLLSSKLGDIPIVIDQNVTIEGEDGSQLYVDNREFEVINVADFTDGYEEIDKNIRCKLCGFLTEEVTVVCGHLQHQHDNWRQEVSRIKKRRLGNVNANPYWQDELKRNFYEIIISKCSQTTRDSWCSKEVINNKEKFIGVRTEILKILREHIVEIFGTVSTPSLQDLESVVGFLASGYPFMFGDGEGAAGKSKDVSSGYGCGGAFGNRYLAKSLRDRISQKQTALRLEESKAEGTCDGEEETLKIRKGNKAQKYGNVLLSNFSLLFSIFIQGLDDYKFYANCTEAQREKYLSSEALNNFDAREEVYQRNRNAICEEIRKSGKVVDKVVRGFFSDHRHLHSHFIFLPAGADFLKERAAANWTYQVSLMEAYIRKKDREKSFGEKLAEVTEKVLTEYHGTFKQIFIVRFLADLIDKDGRAFFLFETEEIVTDGPFLKVVEQNDRSVALFVAFDYISYL